MPTQLFVTDHFFLKQGTIMRSLLRQGQQPEGFNRSEVRAVVTRLVAEEVAFAERTADPFGIDHDCINPSGHDFIGSCGDIVCVHCVRVLPR